MIPAPVLLCRYMCLPWVWACVLRLIQGRPLMHRFGKRTLVVVDVPYVHQVRGGGGGWL